MDTRMSELLDLGSPVPDLVDSFTRNEPYFGSSLGGGDAQYNRSSKRWGSKSSASSGKSVKSGALSTSRHHEASEQNIPHSRFNYNRQGPPRPKMMPGNRLSTMSFASTVPSMHLQTPGLLQDGFAFQPSGLAVSVEDEEGEHGMEGNDEGPGDGGEESGARRNGMKSADKHGNGGTMIAERRRQFEGTSVVKNHIQEQTKPSFARIRHETRQTLRPSAKALEVSTTDDGFTRGIKQNSLTIMPCTSTDSIELGRSACPPTDPKMIGLGLRSLSSVSGSEVDWRTAADAIERSIDQASGPSRRSDSSVGLERHRSSKEALNTTDAPLAEATRFIALSHDTQHIGSSPPATTGISPPRTATRSTSTRTNVLPKSFRAESPFCNQVQSSLSPSQSILNLSQKGIASARRQEWEGSGKSAVAPLRLGRSSGSSTTIKPVARGPSLLRNFQGERQPSVTGSATTERKQSQASNSDPLLSQLSSRQPSVTTAAGRGAENVDLESSVTPPASLNAVKERDFVSKPRRKPAPPITSSLSSRLIRSPSQASTTQSPAVARVNAISAVRGSSSSAEGIGKTLQEDEASVLPARRSSNEGLNDISPMEQTERGFGIHPEAMSQGLAPTPESIHGVGYHRSPSAAPDQSQATSITGPRIGTLSVRNPDPRRNENITQASLFQQGEGDSYFNVNAGLGIPIPAPQPHAFPFAKTYSDSPAPPKFGGQSPVIPTSPDLSSQSKPTFADKVYSKSPLSKSPGKGLMGKMVGAAKKVHTGIKGRGGNAQRLMHNEAPAPEPLSRPRINLDRTSTISQVPTAVQRQEERDLQHHWGPEKYYIQGGMTNPVGQLAVVDGDPCHAPARERELPPLPQGILIPARADALNHVQPGETRDLIDRSETDPTSPKMLPGGNDMTLQAGARSPKTEPPLPAVPIDENPAIQDDSSSPVAIPPPIPDNNQPITHERGLSVFKSRRLPHAPRHLTMPAPLALGDAQHVVPPVMPVGFPTPVSLTRPQGVDGTAPLNIASRLSQQPRASPVEVLDNIAEGLNDLSPTKTERYRKVANWAKDAAIAPPPLDGPQNDGQEAALERDEDRLAVEHVTFASPNPQLRTLPSIRNKLPEPPLETFIQAPLPAPLEGTPDILTRTMPGGPLPQDEESEPHLPANHLDTSNVDLHFPLKAEPKFQTIAMDASPTMGEEQQQTPLEPEQPQVQVLPEATQLQRDVPREAVLVNEDQAEILSKTNALLEMISSIQQKLEDLPSAVPILPNQRDESEAGMGPTVLMNDPVSAPEPGDTVADHREQLDHIVTALADMRMLHDGSREALQEDQMKLEGHLQQLGSLTTGFQGQLQGDMHNLHGNMQNMMRATEVLHTQQESLRAGLGLGDPVAGDLPRPDLGSRLDHLSTMVASIHASSDSQGPMAARLDHVIDVLGGMQSKPDPPPPITSEELTAIVERENTKHVEVLRSIAKDLIRDMHNERALMVSALSEATAVEVERHVASMNSELEEKRQELDALETQRKDLEATISDLLRIQTRYKGPQSPTTRQVPLAPVRPMPGAMPMPRPQPWAMTGPPPQLPVRVPPAGPPGMPTSGRLSTRPLPTPSPRPVVRY